MKISRATAVCLSSRQFSTMLFIVFTLAIFGIYTDETYAASPCELEVARIVSLQGMVELRRPQEAVWQQADMNTVLCAGDMLRARSQSRAALRLSNDSMLRLDQRTSITFPPLQAEKSSSLLDLFEGAIHIITRTPKPFKIRTPFVNASVEGTEFLVGVHEDNTEVVVYEGSVSVSNDLGRVVLNDHEAAITYKDQAPRKELIIRPTDAVQWALYYPAILDYWQNDGLNKKGKDNDLIRQASRLLTVGQADEARKIIEQILQSEADNSDAHALLALIAVVQNEKDQARELATQAIALDPQSAAAHLALSYTQQAHFDIEAALQSVQQAVKLDPQNAVAWARLAELQMSTGYPERALEAAHRAVKLNPDLAKTQTVLGFAHLLQIDTRTAKTIFTQAIALDPADPMPRLGLGLALIREGELEAGRIELEIAASLDPANSLIRSYLGKAYFEEKRYPLASTQFDLAKERDPKDPTPWFYDAIQKQTQNRPVEALRDIQKSIELNDNRAVYRSKFLLDRDEAARGSSLARIFENLGFEKRAIMETAKSLSFDPANHSAHRFLSDTYANIPRHEAARVSELLQAQLLQPINVNPVQPHMVVADLNIITNTGPSNPGFNEFTPLMERNKSQVVASGVVGSNGTLGNEVVLSKLYDRTSISLGQFHYESNGFRKNNDQNHDILNAFIQHAVTSKFNIQAEVRTRSTHQGNLVFDFNRDSDDIILSQNRLRRNIDEDSVRVGARYDLTFNQNIIVSGQYSDRKAEDINVSLRTPLTANRHDIFKFGAYQTEVQYQFRSHWFNVLAGSGVYRTDVESNIKEIRLKSNDLIGSITPTTNFNRDKTNGYLYTNLNLNPNLHATMGFSFDSYTDGKTTIDGFNPKLGFQWNFTSYLRLRMTWIETIKAPLTTNQTIEPTQVAGFNQLFDDLNGTKSRRLGIAIDTNFSKKVFGGIEVSKRDLNVPKYDLNNLSKILFFEDQKENLYRAYLYGLFQNNWSAKSELQYEQFSRAKTTVSGPYQIDTLSIPTGIDYFNPQGFFANLTGTFVRQEVGRRGTENEGIDKFFLVDASVGYRFSNRRGILSLEARNILNEHFLYRNTNFETAELTTNPRFVPTRTIFARVTLNF